MPRLLILAGRDQPSYGHLRKKTPTTEILAMVPTAVNRQPPRTINSAITLLRATIKPNADHSPRSGACHRQGFE